MKHNVQLCLVMPLRDYAAFEDLAEEMQIRITKVEVISDDDAVPKGTQHHVSKRRTKMTSELWDAIKSYPDTMTLIDMRKSLRRNYSNPPSTQTISRVINNYITRPIPDYSVPTGPVGVPQEGEK